MTVSSKGLSSEKLKKIKALVEQKRQVYQSIHRLFQQRGIGRHFKEFPDSLSQSQGIHQMLQDMNGEDEGLRDCVISLIACMMEQDDDTCVKFMKLKLVSNVVKRFI
mmetsp:Transcript_9028/g.15274  ORF Transcript_9028/g.15274 Transcript_9028/m.15274 type:complete len:107 (-) Transcript_9028:294-614(-)